MIVSFRERDVREGRGAGPRGVLAARVWTRQVQTPFGHFAPIHL
jgi:hypothetical protein